MSERRKDAIDAAFANSKGDNTWEPEFHQRLRDYVAEKSPGPSFVGCPGVVASAAFKFGVSYEEAREILCKKVFKPVGERGGGSFIYILGRAL